MRHLLYAAVVLSLAGVAEAHDTWVEANTNIVRVADAIYLDLLLGNHGNEHRDFKLASKADLNASTFEVIAPSGKQYDLKPSAIDMGYAPNEGFWRSKFVPGETGLHVVAHVFDKVVNHGKPLRSVKSGKTYFVASPSLDLVDPPSPPLPAPLGHPLELVAMSHPVLPMGPGVRLRVQLLYKGEPLPNARISFIPRGVTLSEGYDSAYERMTDKRGEAIFEPKTGNQYLLVAHHREPTESGDGFEETSYSATLSLYVPEICPCCE